MPGTLTMNDKQHASAGISVLDQDGQPLASLPEGISAVFENSDPEVAQFVVGPDGLNGDITSGKVGTCIISANVTLQDGTVLTDSISVSVTNTAPGSVNFTVGTPIDE